MAKTKISEFSPTPGNNTDIDDINIAEGCPPSSINNAIRELMSQLKDFQAGTAGDSFNGPIGTTTAAAGAFTTLTTSGAVTHNAGTANGVAFLNGSKVLTTGSALTFDGSLLRVNAPSGMGFQFLETSSGNTNRIQLGTGSGFGFINADAGSGTIALAFQVAGSEQMRLTSTGLGIGTSSPTEKLEVVGGAAIVGVNGFRLQRPVVPSFNGQGAPALEWRFYTTGTTYTTGAYIQALAEDVWTSTSAPTGIRFYTAPSGSTATQQRLHLDSSGNLGLGVTPSAWGGSGVKAFDVGAGASFAGSGADAGMIANAYFDGSNWRYKISSLAVRYQQLIGSGSHAWFNASSGTAGNAISFTQAMTLDASGNLSLGSTSNASRLDITGADNIGPTLAARVYSANRTAFLGFGFNTISSNANASGLFLEALGANNMTFSTNGQERARIDSSGNLLVGTTSAQYKITASNSSSGAVFAQTTAGFGQFAVAVHNTANNGDNSFIIFGTEASFTSRGSITFNRTAGLTAYNTTSDYRAKDIIGLVTDSGALIDSVPVYIGKMKGATQERPMFIAHEVPAYAHTGEKDAVDADGKPVYQQMDASALVPVMWAELQSLRARVAQLESN